jgi:NTE family protein
MAGELVEGFETALVLGGGNALGAYHLGVCEVLLARDEPTRILGCSIGAATGAILLGSPPSARLDRLREFWRAVALPDEPFARILPEQIRARWSNGLGLNALLAGRTGVTRPRFPGWLSLLPGMPPDVALQDNGPLGALLDGLVDWDRLNDSPVLFSLLALDIERGKEVWWDNRRDRITARHILAATALPPLLPPVEIDGRRLWDGGLSSNLPVSRVFAEPPDRPVLILASDLYAPEGDAPGSLDGTATRAQDLAFARQARKEIEGLAQVRALQRRLDPASPPAILAHLVLRPPPHQRALKALDFSATALRERAAQGRADMTAMLARLKAAPRDESLAIMGLP